MGHYILQLGSLWFKVCELGEVDGSKYVNYSVCISCNDLEQGCFTAPEIGLQRTALPQSLQEVRGRKVGEDETKSVSF